MPEICIMEHRKGDRRPTRPSRIVKMPHLLQRVSTIANDNAFETLCSLVSALAAQHEHDRVNACVCK